MRVYVYPCVCVPVGFFLSLKKETLPCVRTKAAVCAPAGQRHLSNNKKEPNKLLASLCCWSCDKGEGGGGRGIEHGEAAPL